MRRWAKAEKETLLSHEVAYRIYQDILLSLESYTDDSFETRFFLPEELSEQGKMTAFSFAQILYTPKLTPEETMSSRLYYLFYLTIMYGIQIYLKELSYTSGYSPYSIEKKTETIEQIKIEVTILLGNPLQLSNEAEIVMSLYLQQLLQIKRADTLQITGKVFQEENFEKCFEGMLLWGYLFAKSMVLPLSL